MASKIHFTKMAGAGNDFVICEALPRVSLKSVARAICARTSGVGADGLLVVQTSRTADFRMRIFNPDGSEAEMCGNGVRCFAAYVYHKRRTRKKQFVIDTVAGPVLAQIKKDAVRVRLSPPQGYRPNLHLALQPRPVRVHYIDTGVPHAVIFVKNLERLDVKALAPAIRFHKRFAPRGVNVNFIEPVDERTIAIRTYERGVEDETRACGTGSVAAAIIAALQSPPQGQPLKQARMRVRTAGGELLKVEFCVREDQIEDVWLSGGARFIAEGQFFYKP